MSNCKRLAVLLCALTALVFAACKSTPKGEEQAEKPAEETPQEKPVEPVATEETKQDFSDANAALMEKVAKARDAAAAAGAENANPVGYKIAEDEYAVEQKASEDKNTDLSKALNDLIDRYDALATYAQAKAKKERIDSLGFASYDQSSYDSASKSLDELSTEVGNAATGTALYTKADTANKQFNAILLAGFRVQAKGARSEAYKAKQQADSIKAAVSHKDEYLKAVETFNLGDQNYVTGNPEASVENYTTAKDSFTTLFNTISEARAQAQAAIDAAKKRVADSNTVASQADASTPLGDEKVQGIEDPDAKLLQDDDFTASNNATVTVNETLSEGAEAK